MKCSENSESENVAQKLKNLETKIHKPNNFYLYGNTECLQYNLQLQTNFRTPYFLSSQHEHKYPENIISVLSTQNMEIRWCW